MDDTIDAGRRRGNEFVGGIHDSIYTGRGDAGIEEGQSFDVAFAAGDPQRKDHSSIDRELRRHDQRRAVQPLDGEREQTSAAYSS